MKDMIEVGGVMRPSTYEKAMELAEKQQKPIDQARQRVREAEEVLLHVCLKQYPVGSRVTVNVAARRSPIHEVMSVNEHGWMMLKNCETGTMRGMSASSNLISPCQCWYAKVEKKR